MHDRPFSRVPLMLALSVIFLPSLIGQKPPAGKALISPSAVAQAPTAYVLNPQSFHHYMEQFRHEEKEATGATAPDTWSWMEQNVPWFESSDQRFQEIYYFRWYSFQKHIVATPRGDVISEFLPQMKWAGMGRTIGVAVPHQLREARWMRNPALAESDSRFWLSPDAPHKRDYSLALADSIDAVSLATGNNKLSTDLLSAMVDNYRAWEATHEDKNGLFWSIDTRDGMEISISGDGYRPTLNSYMYGDAKAIERIAALNGEAALSQEFAKKAKEQRERIETNLWNATDQFYEVVSPATDSGIRALPKFKEPGTVMKSASVRELIGYIPWYFNIPPPDHAVAWKQIKDPQGFAGKFGPPTAERRSPRFRYENDDQCQWNGPMWGFATTQTLVAMANLLNGQTQDAVTRADYLQLFSEYVDSHHLRLPDGKTIPWLDEALDADTGEWITRRLLIERKSPIAGRGAYYDHSGFIDPLVTGLVGLRPGAGRTIVINPLLPKGTWTYFALDGLPYHGHLLTILYDKEGARYHKGKGLILLVDGKRKASRVDLGELRASI